MGSSKTDAGVSLMQNLRRNHWQKARQRLGKAPRKDSQRPGSGAGKGPAGPIKSLAKGRAGLLLRAVATLWPAAKACEKGLRQRLAKEAAAEVAAEVAEKVAEKVSRAMQQGHE